MTNKFNLGAFIEEHLNYINRNDVCVAWGENCIYISCLYPGFDNDQDFVSLELCFTYPTVELFESFFSIKSIHDLECITPRQLLFHFENGNMELYCYIDDALFGGGMRFQKNGNQLLGVEESTGIGHAISTTLESANDYIQYTCNYFLKRSDPSPGKTEFSES